MHKCVYLIVVGPDGGFITEEGRHPRRVEAPPHQARQVQAPDPAQSFVTKYAFQMEYFKS